MSSPSSPNTSATLCQTLSNYLNKNAIAPSRIIKEETLLEVEDLTVSFATEEGRVKVVEEVSFSVKSGRSVGLVGESGCGKSVSALTIMRLLPSPPCLIHSGRVRFAEYADLLSLSDKQMRSIRGNRISMIFQEPMTSLNPILTISFQLCEVLRIHKGLSRNEAHARSVEIIEKIGVGAPEKRMSQYPHHLSGGLRQRIMIAMALLCGPSLLIADEPTTALDVTIQAQILDLLINLQKDLGMSVLLITHDLGVVAEFCSEVYVMYAGRIVEHAEVSNLFQNPRHPYTQGLLSSNPRLDVKREWLPTIPGMVPSPDNRGKGCYFVDRCTRPILRCGSEAPILEQIDQGHSIACWNPI